MFTLLNIIFVNIVLPIDLYNSAFKSIELPFSINNLLSEKYIYVYIYIN